MRKKRKSDVLERNTRLGSGDTSLLRMGIGGVPKSRESLHAHESISSAGDLAPADTIRLRMIGNSDSSEDQDIKLAVRDV